MTQNKTDIYVYAHWQGMLEPKMIGILSAQQAKGKKAFSFEYDNNRIKTLTIDLQLVRVFCF
jgi:serine/threonine-protein kinase HipA